MNFENLSSAELSVTEKKFVREAYTFLENPGLLIRLANKLGKPLEATLGLLPEKYRKLIQESTQRALLKGLVLVSGSLSKRPSDRGFAAAANDTHVYGLLHSAAAFGTGAVGGVFGISGLAMELPITTGIMLRSIASIADEFKMDLRDPKVQLECLYVLSLGSPRTPADDDMEFAYWSSRIAFAQTMNQAASVLARAVLRETEIAGSPILLRFIAQIAARFEIVVSEKALAQLVPALGAIGGGVINAAFTDYFSTAARYHFGLRALEKTYGESKVKTAYKEAHAKLSARLED